MNTMLDSQVTVTEIERRVSVFSKVLPFSPESKRWTITEVSRVMLKFATIRTFDPAKEGDKIDLHHALRVQFYSDIRISARARAQQIREDNAKRQLNNTLSLGYHVN